jgi:hypothetical protein
MARTREEVRQFAMELVQPSPGWWDAWTAEAACRYQRLESGEDAGLTLEEFWSDEA